MDHQAPDGEEPLPPRPQPPRDSDCCGSDCPLCVFTLYERELGRWQEQVAEIKRRCAGADGGLVPAVDATGGPTAPGRP